MIIKAYAAAKATIFIHWAPFLFNINFYTLHFLKRNNENTAILVLGFKLLAGALASCAFIGVAVGVGLIFASLVYSIARNPSQREELLRYSFIGFSLVEASGLIGLVMGFVLLFGF